MKFELVILEELSGNRATIYSVYLDEEDTTLFDKFVSENIADFPKEVSNINNQLLTIGNKTGAIEIYFAKPEGKPGQGIWDLRDKPKRSLRLYCMLIGKGVVILGGGGPKTTRTIQKDPKLKYENDLMRKVSELLTQKMKPDEKEIWLSEDGMELLSSDDLILGNFDPEED